RHQHPPIDGEPPTVQLALADQVRERLASGPPRDEVVEARRDHWLNLALAVGQQAAFRRAKDVGQQPAGLASWAVYAGLLESSRGLAEQRSDRQRTWCRGPAHRSPVLSPRPRARRPARADRSAARSSPASLLAGC